MYRVCKGYGPIEWRFCVDGVMHAEPPKNVLKSGYYFRNKWTRQWEKGGKCVEVRFGVYDRRGLEG